MRARALLAICVVFVGGWALVSPWKNAPVIDDWVYAWSVQQLLETGRLRVLDYSSIYPIAQALWGALFAAVAGFSFGILRLSTVIVAIAGCYATYLMLLELDVQPLASLLAALTMALSPVFFAMSFTFMTDVPFVSVSSIALYFYVSATTRREPARLWWGGLAAFVAFLIRPLAVVLPIAAAAGVSPRRWREATRHAMPPLGAALAAMLAAWFVMPRLFGALPVAESRVEGLNYLATVLPSEYVQWTFGAAIISVFPFAPLLLVPLASRRRLIPIAGASAAVAAISWILVRRLETPLPDWQTWSLQDIASRGGLLGGDLAPSAWSVRAAPFVAVAGIIVLGSFLVGLAVATYHRKRAALILVAYCALHGLLFNVLWFFNDRYYLVLAPALAYFAAVPVSSVRWNRRLLWIAAPVLALWAFVSVTGTRDMIATNDTVERLADDLEAQGVPPSEIDAGYTSNGWRLYAHPENLPPHANRRYDVPFVTGGNPTTYRIVNVPGPDEEVVREARLPSALWQVSDRVYVVRRKER